jgi:hypothetical protein
MSPLDSLRQHLWRKTNEMPPPAFFRAHDIWETVRDLDSERLLVGSTDPDNLMFLRFATFVIVQNGLSSKAPIESAKAWVEFLLSLASAPARAQEFIDKVANDTVFYQPYSSIPQPPKPRQKWVKEWEDDVLRWMDKPQDLTAVELELALAIFEWRGHEPRFADWLTCCHPYLLPQIHRYLLRHYTYPLLKSFNQTLKAMEKEDQRIYKAGELCNLPLRLIGSVTVGAFAMMGAGQLFPLLAQPRGVFHAAFALLLSLVLIFAALRPLLRHEVLRQNRGLIVSDPHMRPRLRSLFGSTLKWACGVSFSVKLLLTIMPKLDKLSLERLVQTLTSYTWMQIAQIALAQFAGFLSMAAVAAVVGILIQWLWDDHSGLET